MGISIICLPSNMPNTIAQTAKSLVYLFSQWDVGIKYMKTLLSTIILLIFVSLFLGCSGQADSVKDNPKELEKKVDNDNPC